MSDRERLYDTGEYHVVLGYSEVGRQAFAVRDSGGIGTSDYFVGYVRPWRWPFSFLRPSLESAARQAIRCAEKETRRLLEHRAAVAGVTRSVAAEGDVRAIVAELSD